MTTISFCNQKDCTRHKHISFGLFRAHFRKWYTPYCYHAFSCWWAWSLTLSKFVAGDLGSVVRVCVSGWVLLGVAISPKEHREAAFGYVLFVGMEYGVIGGICMSRTRFGQISSSPWVGLKAESRRQRTRPSFAPFFTNEFDPVDALGKLFGYATLDFPWLLVFLLP